MILLINIIKLNLKLFSYKNKFKIKKVSLI